MKSMFCATVMLTLALFLSSDEVFGHGGQFRGPGDQIPPGLRPPGDPVPPPPPPPSEGPPPVTGSPPVPGAPPTVPEAPTTTPQAPVPTMPGSLRGRRTSATTAEDWRFWYHHNKDSIQNLKRALYALMSSDPVFFVVGDGESDNVNAATRLTARKVRQTVIPALLWAMDPKNGTDGDTRSAAYIALAKVATDPAHVQAILGGLDLTRKRHYLVRESSALALGLLRRGRPDDRFPARELDGVRALLFDVFENDAHTTRVRAFAAASIGLLGDQPTEFADVTTTHLFDLLRAEYADVDLPLSLLVAVGLQPSRSVGAAQRETLQELALKGRLGGRRVDKLMAAYAANALGRIGTANEVRSLGHLLATGRNVHARRSAAIGLGMLGGHVAGADRIEVARKLLRATQRDRDTTTRNFAAISLARILAGEARVAETHVLAETDAEDRLLEIAADGRRLERPFGALALGIVVAAVTDELAIDAWQEHREEAVLALRDGLAKAGDARLRAAFATALGIARDTRSRKALTALVADRDEDPELRAYAALAVGLVGQPTRESVTAIAKAMRERSSEILRREAAVGLGLLGNPRVPGTGKDAVELLLDELGSARTQHHKGQVVLAVSRIGDYRVVDRLVAMLKDPGERDLTRAMACAGLGLAGDLEWIPSFALLSENVNYRATTSTIREWLSIL